ncbi:hypothetical protein LAD74_00380 [Mycoplasma sp. U97]|uniref:MAG3240 family lipoprotein n=1 Tax=Mycoplasma tauri TaxID=547987 RepID=UPI001CC11E9D|nr:hypothetical protein [Mycoplasma tauri]MBZ4212455.1 hypothetical protein [Mycoplasma tauri]
MKRKLFAKLSVPVLLIPFTVISCSKQKNENIFGIENKDYVEVEDIFYGISLSELKRTTLENLYENLVNKNIKLKLDNDVNNYKINENDKDILFLYKNNWYSLKSFTTKIKDFNFEDLVKKFSLTNNNGHYKIIRSDDKNGALDVDILFNFQREHNKEASHYNQYKDLIFKERFEKDKIQSYIIPDLQFLIQEYIRIPDKKFPQQTMLNNIRAKGFKNLENQQDFLEKRLQETINLFVFKNGNDKYLEKIKIKNIKVVSDKIISLNIDMFASDGSSILNDEQKNMKFYISNFYDGRYEQYEDLKTEKSLQIDPDNEILLSEKHNLPEVKFRKNPLSWMTIDNLAHPNYSYSEFNLNGLAMVFHLLKDDIYLSKNNVELPYKIGGFKNTKLLNNSHSIGKLILYDEKNIENYLYSIDFNLHHHITSQGYYLTNELGIDKQDTNKYFSYSTNDKKFDEYGNLTMPKSIKPDDFFNENFNDIFNFLIHKQINNINLWRNNSMDSISVYEVIKHKKFYEKWLSVIISQYVLLYNIISNQNDEKTLIKYVKITLPDGDEYDSKIHGLGNLPINVQFIDHNNNPMLKNVNNKFLLTGFKGYDRSKIELKKSEFNNQNISYDTEFPYRNRTLPYLINFD